MENGDSRQALSSEDSQKQTSPRKSSSQTDHEEKTVYLKFLLSNAEAGSVIGKGGSAISDLQSQSGARIQLSRNFEFFPGTSDRIVMLSGAVYDVLKALDLILSKLTQEFSVDETDAEPQTRLRLVVPNMCCGGIIGKQGTIIKSFIDDSGATIKLSPPDMYNGIRDRLVTLIGNLGEQLRGVELILLKLSEDVNYIQSINAPFPYPVAMGYNGHNNHGHNGFPGKFQDSRPPPQNKERNTSSVTIGVADEHIGLVVGRGGRNLTDISQISGARIKISDRNDFISGTSDRKVTITGSQHAIRVAEAMIIQKVASASERVDDGGVVSS